MSAELLIGNWKLVSWQVVLGDVPENHSGYCFLTSGISYGCGDYVVVTCPLRKRTRRDDLALAKAFGRPESIFAAHGLISALQQAVPFFFEHRHSADDASAQLGVRDVGSGVFPGVGAPATCTALRPQNQARLRIGRRAPLCGAF